MRLRVLSSLLLLSYPAYLLAADTASKVQKFSAPARNFRFKYNFTVKDIPRRREASARMGSSPADRPASGGARSGRQGPSENADDA